MTNEKEPNTEINKELNAEADIELTTDADPDAEADIENSNELADEVDDLEDKVSEHTADEEQHLQLKGNVQEKMNLFKERSKHVIGCENCLHKDIDIVKAPCHACIFESNGFFSYWAPVGD